MASTLLTPLSISVPIVDPATGNPTPYFQRILQILLKEKAITDELAEGAVQASRQIISGGGLTGGGNLTVDRTLAVGAGTGITVNADDVALDLTYVDERIRDIIGVALIAGSNITLTVDDAANTITIASSGGGSSSTLSTKWTSTGTPASTVETQLHGYTLPANTINTDGRGIEYEFSGTLANTTRQRIVNFKINGQIIIQISTTTATETAWHIMGYTLRTSATAGIQWQRIEWINGSTGRMAFDQMKTLTVGSLNWAANQTVEVTGQCTTAGAAANDVVCMMGKIQQI